jgi:hypothetical protein
VLPCENNIPLSLTLILTQIPNPNLGPNLVAANQQILQSVNISSATSNLMRQQQHIVTCPWVCCVAARIHQIISGSMKSGVRHWGWKKRKETLLWREINRGMVLNCKYIKCTSCNQSSNVWQYSGSLTFIRRHHEVVHSICTTSHIHHQLLSESRDLNNSC